MACVRWEYYIDSNVFGRLSTVSEAAASSRWETFVGRLAPSPTRRLREDKKPDLITNGYRYWMDQFGWVLRYPDDGVIPTEEFDTEVYLSRPEPQTEPVDTWGADFIAGVEEF